MTDARDAPPEPSQYAVHIHEMRDAIRDVAARPTQVGPAERLTRATAAVLAEDPDMAFDVLRDARGFLLNERSTRAVVAAVSAGAMVDITTFPLDPDARIEFLEVGLKFLDSPTVTGAVSYDDTRATLLEQIADAYAFATGTLADGAKANFYAAKSAHLRSGAAVARTEAAFVAATRAADRGPAVGR